MEVVSFITPHKKNPRGKVENIQKKFRQTSHHGKQLTDNDGHAELIKSVDFEAIKTFESQYVEAIKALWADSGVQTCYSRRSEYQLIDPAKFYFDEIDRIAMADYVPTQQDILRSRAPTTGIIEFQFNLDDHVIRIIDVGGQRTERKKWLHCFENVNTIIYLVAINEYDMTLRESKTDNRLKESIALFKTLTGSKCFYSTPVIIFFNKNDILEEKIMKYHLKDYFPEYIGPPMDAVCAREFIKSMFISTKREKKCYYSHFTCATDTENIKVVFAAVIDVILQRSIRLFDIT